MLSHLPRSPDAALSLLIAPLLRLPRCRSQTCPWMPIASVL